MKSNYDKIIEQYESIYNDEYDSGFDKRYTLKEAGILLNISYRTMKYRAQSIYEKYLSSDLIFKRGKSYSISYKLLDEFQLLKRRKDKPTTLFSHEWVTNISWTTRDFYEASYHSQLFEDLQSLAPDVHMIGCVEIDNNGRNHVHLLADAQPYQIKSKLEAVLNDYLDDDRYYRLYCKEARNRAKSIEYFLKNPVLKLNNSNYKF